MCTVEQARTAVHNIEGADARRWHGHHTRHAAVGCPHHPGRTDRGVPILALLLRAIVHRCPMICIPYGMIFILYLVRHQVAWWSAGGIGSRGSEVVDTGRARPRDRGRTGRLEVHYRTVRPARSGARSAGVAARTGFADSLNRILLIVAAVASLTLIRSRDLVVAPAASDTDTGTENASLTVAQPAK
jgi:hypothetical protein